MYEDWMIESLDKLITELGILPTLDLMSAVIRGKYDDKSSLDIAEELRQLGQFGPIVKP